jgi:hypothetical protein
MLNCTLPGIGCNINSAGVATSAEEMFFFAFNLEVMDTEIAVWVMRRRSEELAVSVSLRWHRNVVVLADVRRRRISLSK